ncbi:TRAP transporter substrate-binding protein [Clostridia bacterium UC5.1-1D1]|uniref:TRAP transporter substrate-binding protein n=1 Tax=Agathobaculum massiliense TaxID=3014267 RepID=UPI0006C7D7CC
MKKIVALILASTMSLGLLVGCGSNSAAGSGNDAQGKDSGNGEKVVIRIGHAQNEQSDWHLALEEFKKSVEEQSDGSMTVEIYASETLGNEMDNIASVQQGNCEGVVSGDSMSNWTPYAALLAMPYAINSLDDLITIASSDEVGGVIEEKIIENVKLHPVGFFIRTARNLTSNKKVESIDDMKGLKIRVPNNPLHVKLWNAFGASATPMAQSEVFSALQNGTIDAQENPYANILANNLQEVQDYLVKTEHIFSWIYVLLGEDFWQTLTEEQQGIINTAAEAMQKFQWDYIKNAAADQEAQLQETMEFIDIDKTPLMEISKQVLKEELEPDVYELYLKMVDMNA